MSWTLKVLNIIHGPKPLNMVKQAIFLDTLGSSEGRFEAFRLGLIGVYKIQVLCLDPSVCIARAVLAEEGVKLSSSYHLAG